MKAKKKGKKRQRSLQDYLSIGYLFLIVCGMVKDIIYYKCLGINIISYSSIIDVLLSPIAYISENNIVGVFLLVVLPLTYWGYWNRLKIHEFRKKRGWYSKNTDIADLDEKYAKPGSIDELLIFFGTMLFIFFLGTAVGEGPKKAQMVKDKVFEANHRIVFNDNETVMVRLLGQNSQFLFYVQPKSDKVIIVPIQAKD